MNEKKKGLVIGNCQAQPLSMTLNFYCRDVTFDYFSVHILPAITREEAIEEFKQSVLDKYHIILAAPLSEDFGAISTAHIRESFPHAHVLSIPNFYFSGLHPDLTYLGSLGERIVGPLGDYHSKLAAMGFIQGVPLRELEALFNGNTYHIAGYFENYRNSLDELFSREDEVDVKFSSELEGLLTEDHCFFSVNHPTNFLFGHFVDKLSKVLADIGLVKRFAWLPHPSTLPNILSTNNIYPVFPEIAEAHKLQFEGSYIFKPSFDQSIFNSMGLSEFLAGEYACFEAFGRDKVTSSTAASNIITQLSGAF